MTHPSWLFQQFDSKREEEVVIIMHTKQPKKKNTEQWEQNIVTRHTSSSFIGFIKGLFGMTPTQADLLHLEALLHCSGALPDEVRLKDEHYFMSIGQINVFTWGKVQEM